MRELSATDEPLVFVEKKFLAQHDTHEGRNFEEVGGGAPRNTHRLMRESRQVIVNVTRMALRGISLLETLASHGLKGNALSRANANSCLDEVAIKVRMPANPKIMGKMVKAVAPPVVPVAL